MSTDKAERPVKGSPRDIGNFATGIWVEAEDLERVASLIAIIALGQARHAAGILNLLGPAEPLFTTEELITGAANKFTLSGDTDAERDTSRWHRDGLLFECLSWIAVRGEYAEHALIRDPHLSSTTQGLDGLVIDWDKATNSVTLVTITEEKCSTKPRRKFLNEVIPAFQSHHAHGRDADLVSNTLALLQGTEIEPAAAGLAATDLGRRAYRAGIAVTTTFDTKPKLTNLFKDFDRIPNVPSARLLGVAFATSTDLRDWFDTLAQLTLSALSALADETGDSV